MRNYKRLNQKLKLASDSSQVFELTEYMPYLDTIKTSLEFLQQKADGIYNSQLKEAQELLQQYQNRIQITNTIKQEIQQREQLLKEQFYNLGFVKELQKINNGSSQALAGLQTRASIQEIVNQRFNLTPEHFSGGGNGINPQQFMQQQIQAAQTELTTLKDKINQLGSSSSDMETPNFIPNSQKTKSFLKSLEIVLDTIQ